MSITSSVGLISGIDTGALIQQLIAIDSRPKIFAQNRIAQLKQQQASYLSVNSALLGLKSAGQAFRIQDVFDAATATSSNPNLLSATASNGAVAGEYNFIVKQLVSTQQNISRGFTDTDVSGLGLTELSFESQAASLTSSTALAELRGGEGIRRGEMVINESGGGTATIDLSDAVTVDDVLEAINTQTDIDITATVEGDSIKLTQGSGLSFTVEDASGDFAATDLGISGSSASVFGTQTLTGSGIVSVAGTTALSILNDGNGVSIRDDVDTTDFTITAADGTNINVDLGEQTDTVDGEITVVATAVTTLQEAIDRINTAASDAGANVTASINAAGTGLQIADNTGGGGDTVIADNGSRTAAADLGIAGTFTGGNVQGRRLIAGLNSTLASTFNGGSGITGSTLSITDRSGSATVINLTDAQRSGSVSDLLADINNQLFASGTLAQVKLNDAGTGLAVEDVSGGLGNLVIGGDAADDLGIQTAGVAASSFTGDNVQKKWISGASLLSELNNGEGLGSGSIRFTTSDGAASNAISIPNSLRTVDDLLSFLNSRPVDIEARINANGDGIEIIDTAGGAGSLVIEDDTGAIASRLNIEGTFENPGGGGAPTAAGSFQFDFTFDPTDTIDDILSEINNAGAPVVATVINDGSPSTPFRISFTARQSGADGGVLIDSGGFDLGLQELSEARDAIVFYGNADPAEAILLTSGNNSLDGVIQGVSIDLLQASDSPITVTVSESLDEAEAAAQSFVDSFNNVFDVIDGLDFYNAETEKRPLLGDQTVRNVKSRLVSQIQSGALAVNSQFDFLFQVGIKIGEGARLEFDVEQFREAYAKDPQGVEDLFAASKLLPREPIEVAPGITTPNDGPDQYETQGIAELIASLADSFTDSIDGLLTRRTNTLDNQIELQEDRVEQFDRQLNIKRARLEAEFLAMESALAQLQTQQQSLQTLQG